jgi:hypothetical protein
MPRVFALDVQRGPPCGERRRILAAIAEARALRGAAVVRGARTGLLR